VILPRFRTEEYAIWRACERIGIRPPDVNDGWNETDVWMQAMAIAYSQIREMEDAEEHKNLLRAAGIKIM